MNLVIISGKGGTGKTTIASAFSFLNKEAIKIDCDVDASNLHIILKGEEVHKEDYMGGEAAFIHKDKCKECGLCVKHCKFQAITNYEVGNNCEGCGVCMLVCPYEAISMNEKKRATLFVDNTVSGKLYRSEMEIGADKAGKLITHIRKMAERQSEKSQWSILDGSPGIGCSVIASITNCDVALIVTEPTISAFNDFKRVSELTEHFNIKTYCCINKWDLNKELSLEMKNYCEDKGIKILGEISYDILVNDAINNLVPITSYENSRAGKEIKEMYKRLYEEVNYEDSSTKRK